MALNTLERHGGTAFVTGATGLLGNNLVRELVQKGFCVKALSRSRQKAKAQFSDLPGVEVVIGDLSDIAGFAASMQGCDLLFHTAAFFRDSYKGGNHGDSLERINVTGTQNLLEAAYAQGIRHCVHISSIAVLRGERGAMVDETQLRKPEDGDDYYRSKIFSDQVVNAFLNKHADFNAVFVLPGWMWGPGDMGPTSAAQFARDIIDQKMPGIVQGSVALVDARDVALIAIAAAAHGRRGERYLAAGQHITTGELIPMLGKLAGVATPTRKIPPALLLPIALLQEIMARISGKPALLSLATVRALRNENERSRFSTEKTQRELGVPFRDIRLTLEDTIRWLRTTPLQS